MPWLAAFWIRWGRGLLLLVLLAMPAGLAAQSPLSQKKAVTKPLPPDRAAVAPPRQPDPTRLRELRASRDLRYVEGPAEISAWDIFWANFWRWVLEHFGTEGTRRAWKIGLYAVLIAAVVFAVAKLLQVDFTMLFGRAPRQGPLAYDLENENIHELDFLTRIQEAEAAGNYRLALRLGYLQALKIMSDKQLIDWQPDKTNQTYLREVGAASALHHSFWELTRQFDYVWYGELPLPKALYSAARDGQLGFQRQVAGENGGRNTSVRFLKVAG